MQHAAQVRAEFYFLKIYLRLRDLSETKETHAARTSLEESSLVTSVILQLHLENVRNLHVLLLSLQG